MSEGLAKRAVNGRGGVFPDQISQLFFESMDRDHQTYAFKLKQNGISSLQKI